MSKVVFDKLLGIQLSHNHVNLNGDIMTGNLTVPKVILSSGIIYPSADSTTAIQINKADGITNILNVDTTNGRVGIGTTGPVTRFQVFDGEISLTRAATTSYRQFIVYDPNISFGWAIGLRANDSNLHFYDIAGASNRMVIDTNGNVGIGTTGPGAQLQVNAGAATTTGTIIKGAVSQSANLQEWQNSNANVLFAHSAGFDTLFRNTTDSSSSASPNTLSFYGKNGSGNDTLITKLTIGKIGGAAGDIFGQFNINFRTSTVFSLSEAGSTKQLTLSLAPASSGFLNVNLTAGSDQTATTPILNLQDSTSSNVINMFHTGSVYALRDFISPNGGIGQYANLLTYSEDFTNAIWVHAGTFTVTGDATTAPNGMVTADSVNFGASSSSTLTQTSNSAAASKTYAASIWYKYFINSGTGGNLTLTIGDSTFSESATTSGSINSTVTTWTRLTVTKTFTAGATGNVAVQLNSNHPSGDNWGAYIWGAQLEENSSAGPYAFTSSSTMPASQGMILNNALRLTEGININLGATTGTKIGTATSQKLGFYNATPVVQQAHIVNADGTLADVTSKFNTLLSYLQNLGLLAAV